VLISLYIPKRKKLSTNVGCLLFSFNTSHPLRLKVNKKVFVNLKPEMLFKWK